MTHATFDARFRQHTIPAMAALCDKVALQLFHKQLSYSEAFYEVWWFGWRCGASHLTHDRLTDLDDWLSDRLLRAATQHEADEWADDDESAWDWG